MTDPAVKLTLRRRQMPLPNRRRPWALLLVLLLITGSWALLSHQEKLAAIPEIFTWLKLDNEVKSQASTPPASPRGDIFDRNFRPLAVTYETYALYVRPLEMESPAATAALLEEILELEQNKLLAAFKGERGFVWIAKGVDRQLAAAIEDRNIKGVYQVVETKRFYPNYDTAAHAVGFVEHGQGLDGIEFKYNALLRGDEITSAELAGLNFSPDHQFSRAGAHLVLSLDLMIQEKIEHFLKKRVQSTGATKGAVLLMDAETGGIIAMASYPVFNPNLYWEYSSAALDNNAVSAPVYPGELALIFQQAAAINVKNNLKSMTADTLQDTAPLPLLEPEILKKRKLSFAPRVASVDPEYLAQFAEHLGLGLKPVTDIPLKDGVPVSSPAALTDPSFHISALQLLAGFTVLLNNGRATTPHLLHKAYPREGAEPVAPTPANSAQLVPLHPDTRDDLIDFLAAKWLKLKRRKKSAQVPMFFEAHRYESTPAKTDQVGTGIAVPASSVQIPYITQSIMLGAIPGRNPKLTMLAMLTYPDGSDEDYPDVLEAFGDKFSILSPDQQMVEKILDLAAQHPPVPSADFWNNRSNLLAADVDPLSPQNRTFNEVSINRKKIMPDVTGRSLRAGLHVLQHYPLDINIVGSGMIISQNPAAGAELNDITECNLQLRQEI